MVRLIRTPINGARTAIEELTLEAPAIVSVLYVEPILLFPPKDPSLGILRLFRFIDIDLYPDTFSVHFDTLELTCSNHIVL